MLLLLNDAVYRGRVAFRDASAPVYGRGFFSVDRDLPKVIVAAERCRWRCRRSPIARCRLSVSGALDMIGKLQVMAAYHQIESCTLIQHNAQIHHHELVASVV